MFSMTKDKSIYIKNIYYMLSYAFQVLKQDNYDEVAHEKFDYVQDLFAAILARGVAQQLKQGLYREYVTKHDTLTVMRGKLDMPETIRNRIQRKQRLACEFDELSENNTLNQILKTTINVLMRDKDVAQERKTALRKLWIFFDGVQTLEPSSIHWGRLVYQRNNRNYEMLMNICYFVLDGCSRQPKVVNTKSPTSLTIIWLVCMRSSFWSIMPSTIPTCLRLRQHR